MPSNHHPDTATLCSYAAASLEPAFALLVDWHLEACPACRLSLRAQEALGGELLALMDPLVAPEKTALDKTALENTVPGNSVARPGEVENARAEMDSPTAADEILARLDEPDAKALPTADQRPLAGLPSWLPASLDHWQQTSMDSLPWRRMAPGIRQIRLPWRQGQLKFLRIAPRRRIPAHGHRGQEMTLVLRGAFEDHQGRFEPGDLADLDESTRHEPISDANQECICIIASDAPLDFTAWVPRLMQPLLFR